jgi:hypothetical protein
LIGSRGFGTSRLAKVGDLARSTAVRPVCSKLTSRVRAFSGPPGPGLTPSEEAERVALQAALVRPGDRVAPLPLDGTRKLHQRLLERAIPARARTDR